MIPDGHLISKIIPIKRLPMIMGILNVTPDSFSDGRKYFNREVAVARAKSMISEGADILDIGGESTRPGALKVETEVELERVIPVIESIRQFSQIPISVDTRKSEVAKAAIQAGANIINDVSALQHDPLMTDILAAYPEICVILMHMVGEPENMQNNIQYTDVLSEVENSLLLRVKFCTRNGIEKSRLMLDPGIGFSKSLEHNLTILANLDRFSRLDFPIVVGASRKSFIHAIMPSLPFDRLPGSLAATQICLENDVEVIRIHNVREQIQFISVFQSIAARKLR